MEPFETIKNRRAPGIHRAPLRAPSLGDLGLWGSRDGTPRSEPASPRQTRPPLCRLRVPACGRLASTLPARACTPPGRRAAGSRDAGDGCSHARRRPTGGKHRPQPRHGSAQGSSAGTPGSRLLCPTAGQAGSERQWSPVGRTRSITRMSPAKTRGDEGNLDPQKLAASPWALQAPHGSPHA